MCFHILGFDVLLDKNLKPWLIEVNASPSYNTDTAQDKSVKKGMLIDTFKIIEACMPSKKALDHIERLESQRRELRKKVSVLKN